MAVTVRNSGWGGASTNTSELLVGYINSEIRVLEPQLQYARLGVQRNAPRGYDRILFPQTNQLPVKINTSMVTVGGPTVGGSGSVWGAGASVSGDAGVAPGAPVSSSAGVAAITEGTNPTAITWGATAYSSGPAQYGILVQVSDLLVHNSAIEVIDSCTMQVRNALARLVDTVIQTVVNAGTNGVIYAGGKTSRATLAAGDTLTQTDMGRAYKYLASSNAAGLRPFEGKYYAAVIHPQVEGDLMANTSTGITTTQRYQSSRPQCSATSPSVGVTSKSRQQSSRTRQTLTTHLTSTAQLAVRCLSASHALKTRQGMFASSVQKAQSATKHRLLTFPLYGGED
jgi:hypothetical protein